jgi:hypothetical protein
MQLHGTDRKARGMHSSPLIRAWRLSIATYGRRLLLRIRTHGWLSGALALAALIAIVYAATSSIAADTVAWLAKNEILVAIAAALHALLFVTRRRTRLMREHAQSWLRAAPLPPNAFRVVAALRIALAVLVQLLIASGLLLGAAFATRRPVPTLIASLLWLIAGLLLGSLVGAIWRLHSVPRKKPASRVLFKPRSHAARPSFAGLSRWPIGKALAWHGPENTRVLFILAASSVPAGTSAWFGLIILAMWTLASYLVAVARAVPAVANDATVWLRPTPISFAAFAYAIARRAFVHQLIGTAVLGTVIFLLGGTFAHVAYAASLWVMLTVVVSVIVLRQRFFSRGTRLGRT